LNLNIVLFAYHLGGNLISDGAKTFNLIDCLSNTTIGNHLYSLILLYTCTTLTSELMNKF